MLVEVTARVVVENPNAWDLNTSSEGDIEAETYEGGVVSLTFEWVPEERCGKRGVGVGPPVSRAVWK